MADTDNAGLVFALMIVAVTGGGLAWIMFLTQPVHVFVTCYEDPDYLNYSEHGDHNVVQLDTYTPRWRAFVGMETTNGPTQVLDHNATGKRMVLPNVAFPVEEAAYFYGSAQFTHHYECEQEDIR